MSLGKWFKVGLQAAIAVGIAAVEIIIIKIIWTTAYIFPHSLVLDSIGLGEVLNQIYESATIIIFVWQALVLFVIGMIFTLRNHLRIRNGRRTFNTHRTLMSLFILINVAIALIALGVSNITMEYSLYSLIVPGMLLVSGILQTVLTTRVKSIGPNYGTLNNNR